MRDTSLRGEYIEARLFRQYDTNAFDRGTAERVLELVQKTLTPSSKL